MFNRNNNPVRKTIIAANRVLCNNKEVFLLHRKVVAEEALKDIKLFAAI